MAGDVVCPGCGSKLKSRDDMAGKKVRCKQCGTAFRAGESEPVGTAGDAEGLSVLDQPAVAAPAAEGNPFDFAEPEPKPRKKSVEVKPAKPAIPAPPPPKTARPAPPPPAPTPEAEPVEEISLDDPEPAADAGADDSFAFGPADGDDGPKSSRSKAKPRGKARREDDEDEDDRPRRGSRRDEPKSGSRTLLLFAGAFGFFLLVGGVVVAVVLMNAKKDGDQAKAAPKTEAKKDEPPPPEPPPEPAKDAKKDRDASAKGEKAAGAGKAAAAAPGKGATARPTKAASGGTTDAAAPTRVFALGTTTPLQIAPPADKREVLVKPEQVVGLGVKFPAVRRVVLPPARNADLAVVWQSGPGFQGKGEKLVLERFSTTSGKSVGKLEFDGDGVPDPVCDVSLVPDGEFLAHAAGGKVTVWKLADGSKVVENFDPYADDPEQKAAGVAAVYLANPPTRFATVSGAGAVHVFELMSKQPAGVFKPPRAGSGKLAQGKSAAADSGRKAVVVAVAGAVYLVPFSSAAGEQLFDLGGEVGRSLGLAVGGAVVYAFETAEDAKKEKAVVVAPRGKKPSFYRVPPAVGEPVSAGWADDRLAGVATSTGAVLWFEFEEGAVQPVSLVTGPSDKVLHVPFDSRHWFLVPKPSDPAACLLVELGSPGGPTDPLEGRRKTIPTLRADADGLSK